MNSNFYSLLYLSLILFLASCGKNNESGKTNFPLNGNPYSITNTPFSYRGVNVQQVMNQNPCISGYGSPMMNQPYGNQMMNQPYGNQRVTIQVPLMGFRTQVSPGDIYVGVTSYGDVAVVAGQGIGQPPIFVAYLCPRSFTQSGTGQLSNVEVGANTPTCLFKPITRATVVFPGGATADFRWLDGGNSLRQKFTPPVCL